MKKTGFQKFIRIKDIMLILALLSICLIYLFVNGRSHFIALSFIAGLILFIFNEYITHRFLFHLKPPKNLFALKLLKRLHYDHHKDPNDLHLMFLPVWYSIPQMLVISFVYYLLFPSIVNTIAFASGLMTMLLVYEWKHFVAHQPLTPKTKFGKWLKQTHLLHHYKNENYWYGVSNPFIDMLFGTHKDGKEVDKSQTVRDLVGENTNEEVKF
ncbi:sterol desaturase family protein [Alkalihalobacillus sp. CinArs1]|uniref:sterol desaturase family protein n=1 Tax=Alkalihalobacillus sp. CinArs1 TaxID=2995314 RepID=UPI0022DD020C|nr:sterol desaturase family protein [Alkalihalobacillus sp. CinArs1]